MDKKKIIAVFVLLLGVGLLLDVTEEGHLEQGRRIRRAETGQGGQEFLLRLDASDDTQILENYEYPLSLNEELPDDKKKRELLERAKKEIDEGFCPGQELSHVTSSIHTAESYADGLVEASWSITPAELIDEEGNIIEDQLHKDGKLAEAYVQLNCYDAQESYAFSFMVFPSDKSRKEKLLADVRYAVEESQTEEGEAYLNLPEEMDGVRLTWSEKKSHYLWKILILEIILAVVLVFAKKEQKKKAEKNRWQQMQLDYPEIVSKILILNGSGMSIKQSWHKISASYIDKRDKNNTEERAAYEEMLRTDREIADGISEKIAFQQFGDRIPIASYRRLGRLLAENIQKGARGMDEQLKREAEDAFEARRQTARKLGEEAGTKMMLPMLLMLAIVIAIVMVPALMNF